MSFIIRSDVKRVPEVTGSMIPKEWMSHLLNRVDYKQSWDKYRCYHPAVQEVLIRPRIPSYSDEWKKERQTRITATNTAALISDTNLTGKSPWENRKQLFLRKTGQIREKEKPFLQKCLAHGLHYEAEAAKKYTEITGVVTVEEDIGMVLHPEEEHIAATPDRLAKYLPINVEIKCPYLRRNIKHVIPEYYYAQVQHQMAVLGLKETHFVQYIPPAFNHGIGFIDIVRVEFQPDWWRQAKMEIDEFYKEVAAFYATLGKPIGTFVEVWKEQEKPLARTLDLSKESSFISGKKRKRKPSWDVDKPL